MNTNNPIKHTWQLDLNYYNTCPQNNELDGTNFGFILYPEQKQVLYLMKVLEKQTDIHNLLKDCNIYYNKLRLGAPFSFGKMVVSLALIKTNNIPISRRWYSFFNNEVNRDNQSDILELEVKRKHFVQTTLVIISPSTFHQWVSHIEKAQLKALYIDTLEDFDNLCVKLLNNNLDIFDLVLLVFRKLKYNSSLPFGSPSLDASKNTNLSLLSLLSIDKLWRRVIIDDFDTINIGHDLLIPADIIWFVSSTTNYYYGRYIHHTSNSLSTSAINHRVMDIVKDPLLSLVSINSTLNVNIPQIHVTCYTFEYGGTVNQVLNNLNYPTEVCEKINSGDISGAASLIGLSHHCHSLGEFLYLLIHKNKQSYDIWLKQCNDIQSILTLIDEDPDTFIRDARIEEDNFNIEYNSDYSWSSLLNDLTERRQFLTLNEVEQLSGYLHNCQENAFNVRQVLERIKGNIEDGLCGKCYIEPEDDKFILRCCNTLICKHCIIKNDDSQTFIDRCPSCSARLDKNSFIRLPDSISLDEFLEINLSESIQHLKEFDHHSIEESESNFDINSSLTPKTKGLLCILKNLSLSNIIKRERRGLNMDNVIETEEFIQRPDDFIKKYIIFTRWSTCAQVLHNALIQHNIPNIILKGTNTNRLKKDIDKFKNSANINVMLISSHDICAGLNLEFATHLIFYHSIRNESVTAQLVGRAQRIGRKHSLQLISLENQHEVGMFNDY